MNIAIIGAGAAGLTAAYDLGNAGQRVTIYEAASEVGGLAAGFKAPHWDWTLEKFYHHWFATDHAILGLIRELGWSDQVLFPRPVTVIYFKGKFYPFDSMFTNMPLFLLTHFSPIDVIRFGIAGAYLRFSPNWKPLEQVTADEWTRKYFGANIYNLIWRPMLVGKFGEENLKIVNMAWLWARLHSRTTKLGTFVGGFQAFLNKFADVVKGQGTSIKFNRPVSRIARNERGTLTVTTPDGEENFDAVISTSSPALMARLAPDLPQAYSAKLKGLKSMGAVVMVIALDRKLTPYYWHNLPKEAGFPFLSLVEHTNFLSPEYYGGDHLIYCGDYLDPNHEYFKMDIDALFEKFAASLTRFNPEFERSWVRDYWLSRTPYAQPIPPVNHSQNIPDIRTPLKGLYFASMSQVYPWDRGTNYAVEIGRRTAATVMEDFQGGRQ